MASDPPAKRISAQTGRRPRHAISPEEMRENQRAMNEMAPVAIILIGIPVVAAIIIALIIR